MKKNYKRFFSKNYLFNKKIAKKLKKIAIKIMGKKIVLASKECKKIERRIKKLRVRLLNYGFEEEALNELKKIYSHDNWYAKKLSAIELATWYANSFQKEDAIKCLKLLSWLKKNEDDKIMLRKTAIMEAECYRVCGNLPKARKSLEKILRNEPHADVFLAAANLENNQANKLILINKAFKQHGISEIDFNRSSNVNGFELFNNVGLKKKYVKEPSVDSPVVSVIVPTYNASSTIRATLESILNQTWNNIEVIVVDDASSDGTVSVVSDFMVNNINIKLIKNKINRGTFFAMNSGLKVATGEFVTAHGADDWSHPENISTQVNHLLKNPKVIGNTSQLVRCSDDLFFHRRGRYGVYVIKNHASFMFRRAYVISELGYWDSVRFSADSELMRRVKQMFGKKSVADLKTGPLTISLQASSTLTGNKEFGAEGFYKGARREYHEAQRHFHNTSHNLFYEFPQKKRPFPVPEPMLPVREVRGGERRKFDVVLASDFRLTHDLNFANIEDIKYFKDSGLKLGLVQTKRYDIDPKNRIRNVVRDLIDGDKVQLLVYGEKINCQLLIIRHPAVLDVWQRFLPDIYAGEIKVIADSAPLKIYGEENGKEKKIYEVKKCNMNLERYFGKKGHWYPLNPLIRDALVREKESEAGNLILADTDWPYLINVGEWQRGERPVGNIKKVGRYGVNDKTQWPGKKKEILSVYSGNEGYKVHILGSIKVPQKILKDIPESWVVIDTKDFSTREFLESLDVYLYFPHEAATFINDYFIIAAMAVGVPVVLPEKYRFIFGDAAVYAHQVEVADKIKSLLDDQEFYDKQVKQGRAFVVNNCGYKSYECYLKDILGEYV